MNSGGFVVWFRMNEHDRRNRNDNISIIIQIEEKTNELTANVVYVELKPRKKLKCNLIHKHAKICQMNVKKRYKKITHFFSGQLSAGFFCCNWNSLNFWYGVSFGWFTLRDLLSGRAYVAVFRRLMNEWMTNTQSVLWVFGLVWLVFAKNKKFPQNTARQKENNNKQYSTEYTLRDWNSIKVSLAL